jgi:PAS domain S-box-containing protein
MVQSRKKKSAAGKESPDAEVPAAAPITDNAEASASVNAEDSYERFVGEVEDYAIVMLDPQGTILTWNKGAEKIMGYSAKEAIGKNYRLFYTQEDKENNLATKLLNETRTNGKANYEGWRVRKDGTRFWGSVTITALHHDDGSVRGYIKVTRDLTDKKIAEDKYSNFAEELKLRNEQLKVSEERYHKMISDVMDYAIILLDKDGVILDWNKGAEKLKGYSSKEIIGKSFRMFYPKDEKDSHLPEKLLSEAVKKGSITHEGWRIKKDGNRFWGNIAITTLRDDHGAIIGFTKVTRDLTDKKVAEDKASNILEELRQANDQLKQSEERYHKMIEEVQDYAIILLNKDGEILNWNAGAEMIKGYKSREIVGKNFRIFYPPEDRESKLPEKLLAQAVKTGKATHEGWRLRKDGSRFWGSIVITALHDANRGVIGFSKVTRDLTEIKSAEDTLKTNAAQIDLKNKTLERLNEELSSFTHVASHDLKEPLRKILTYASRIESVGYNSEKSREYVEKIKNSSVRMQNLIDDLLSYSQVSNDTSSMQRIDLNKILQAAKSDLEIAVHEKQAVIDSQMLPVIMGIPYQLHQLFLNLISNAIKFSKPDVKPCILIKAEIIKGPDIPGQMSDGNNKYHHISVADNGIGFEHHDNDKIFQAFERLHPRDVFSGTGIGLAIVKRVIENHNGIISAEGHVGVGATFHLYLPVAAT